MKIYSSRGANVVVGGRRTIFAPFIPIDIPQETADYLLSTGKFQKEGETPIEMEKSLSVRPIKIGVHRVGGFGDALLGSCVIEAIARKFPGAQIIAHCHSTVQRLWQGHPRLHHMETGYHPRLNNTAYVIPKYDLFFDLMPDCNAECNKKTMPPELYRFYEMKKEEINKYKRIPGCRNHLKPFCDSYNFEALDVYNFAFGLDATVKDMYLVQTQKEKDVYNRFREQKLIPEKYISIHDWAFNGRQTKSWYPNRWRELRDLLKKEYDLPTVQIGGAGEEKLFADYDLRGKTTWGESIEILKHSSLHIDNESTPAHVCPALDIPCVVLCGSTMKYWRHRENLNIVGPYPCQECEGAPNWYKVCEDGGSFGCMKSITPEMVFNKIKENFCA